MGYSCDTGKLNFTEAREALVELYDRSTPDRQFTLRLYVLYAFNDKFCRKEGETPSEDDLQFFKENCRAMTEMPETNGTLKAELYREIGDFNKCLQTLDTLDPVGDYEQSVRDRIREKALQGDFKVFKL